MYPHQWSKYLWHLISVTIWRGEIAKAFFGMFQLPITVIYALKSYSWYFDHFAPAVAGQEVPKEPTCKILKVLWKTIHMNQISKLYLNQQLRYGYLKIEKQEKKACRKEKWKSNISGVYGVASPQRLQTKIFLSALTNSQVAVHFFLVLILG